MSAMEDENFDVMISNKEYKELKGVKKQLTDLQQASKNTDTKLNNTLRQLSFIQKQSAKKTNQINYLVQLIESICSGSSNEKEDNPDTGKSAAFQVLGQSVFEPRHERQRQISYQNQELNKKFAPLLQKIVEWQKQFQSRQEIAAEFNETINQKNGAINKLQEDLRQLKLLKQEDASKLEQDLNQKIKLLESSKQDLVNYSTQQENQVKKLQQQIAESKENFKRHIQNLECDIKDLQAQQVKRVEDAKAQKIQSEKNQGRQTQEVQTMKKQLIKHTQQNIKLSSLVKDFSDRTKLLERQIETLKKKAANSEPKMETKMKIKMLVDQNVREVEDSLKSIGELSPQEIKNLVRLEMKQLAEYIQKSITNKK